MTQSRNPGGSGSEYIVDATQIPTTITWDALAGQVNKVQNGVQVYENGVASTTSSDFVWRFVAESNGVIAGLIYGNGAVAADGTNGWELQFLNKSNSDGVVGYFGIGSGTEAAKATDVDTAVAANGSAQIASTVAGRFNKGDVILMTADRDGTTIVGDFQLLVSYESEGR